MDNDEVLELAFPEGEDETAELIHTDGHREAISWTAPDYDVPPKPSDDNLTEDHAWSLWPGADGKLVWVPVPRDPNELIDA